MRLSTRGRYGVKAMFDLALNSNGEPVPLKSVPERQDPSEYIIIWIRLDGCLRKVGLNNMFASLG